MVENSTSESCMICNMAYCAPHSGSDFVYLKWKIESKEDDKKAKNMFEILCAIKHILV